MIAFFANNGTGHPGVWKVPAVGDSNFEAVPNGQTDWDIDWQPRPRAEPNIQRSATCKRAYRELTHEWWDFRHNPLTCGT